MGTTAINGGRGNKTLHPHKAQGKKPRNRRKQGSVKELKMRLWSAIEAASRLVETSEQPDEVIRGVHALGTISGAYLKCCEVVTGEQLNTLINTHLINTAKQNLSLEHGKDSS
jgi:hypothetical protein